MKRGRGRPRNPEKDTSMRLPVSLRDRLEKYVQKQEFLLSRVVERHDPRHLHDAVRELLDLYDITAELMPNLTTETIIYELKKEAAAMKNEQTIKEAQ